MQALLFGLLLWLQVDSITPRGLDAFLQVGSRPSAGLLKLTEPVGKTKETRVEQYQLRIDTSLEQFVNGKRDAARNQQWSLSCESISPFEKIETECRLTRTTFDNWGSTFSLGTVCNQSEFSSTDGTIELASVDWPRGRLDLVLIHDDASKTQVFIDLAYGESLIYLSNLRASNTSRRLVSDEPITVEYRVPSYTYIQPVPVVMTGMKNEWDRGWDEMVASLSSQDRGICQQLVANQWTILETVMRRDAPTIKREAEKIESAGDAGDAPDETLKRLVEPHIHQEIERWLRSAGMSDAGRKTVTGFLRSH